MEDGDGSAGANVGVSRGANVSVSASGLLTPGDMQYRMLDYRSDTDRSLLGQLR